MVLPGEGVSATRFGATFETIERHMEAPCEVKTELRCLYVARGIDFGLKDGVLSSIKIHRRDRVVPGLPEKRYFGAFKGRLGQSILLGLHRHIVLEEFGKPEKVTEAPAGAENGLVESHTYPGLVLEYDRIENGNVVLSAFEILNSKSAKAH